MKSKGSKHDLMGGGQNQKGFVLNEEDFSIEQLKRDDKISGKKWFTYILPSKQIELIWLKCYNIGKIIILSNPSTANLVNRVVFKRHEGINLGHSKARSY